MGMPRAAVPPPSWGAPIQGQELHPHSLSSLALHVCLIRHPPPVMPPSCREMSYQVT